MRANRPAGRWMALALAMVGACGGRAAVTHGVAAPAPEAGTAVDEARGLASEIEESLEHGDASGLAPLCAADLVAVGPRAGDEGRARTDTLIALRDALPGERHKLKVRDQQIDSAAGARSAWLTEQLDVDGKRHAVSAVAAEVDGLWLVTAVNVGATVPERALRGGGAAALP
ncbi:MAG TPA: hypothetical protein VHE35_30005, partial [Kofleriaceae bacterium]|nr:hypothetical protein [Kofleriaceae bacterium]